jgi:tRNA A37 methylthiotransferase MiaB
VRDTLPGAAVRSTFIVGFPGETEADFAELEEFVDEAALAVAGVFVYDPQQGTAAAGFPNAVPRSVALDRAALLGESIEREARHYWEALLGSRIEVLVERGSRGSSPAVGRCALQAPDIDGRTEVRGGTARRGDMVAATVVDSLGYDVKAVAVTGGS